MGLHFPSCPSQNAKSLITDLLPSELEGAAIELEPYLCRKSPREMAVRQEGRGRKGGREGEKGKKEGWKGGKGVVLMGVGKMKRLQ